MMKELSEAIRERLRRISAEESQEIFNEEQKNPLFLDNFESFLNLFKSKDEAQKIISEIYPLFFHSEKPKLKLNISDVDSPKIMPIWLKAAQEVSPRVYLKKEVEKIDLEISKCMEEIEKIKSKPSSDQIVPAPEPQLVEATNYPEDQTCDDAELEVLAAIESLLQENKIEYIHKLINWRLAQLGHSVPRRLPTNPFSRPVSNPDSSQIINIIKLDQEDDPPKFITLGSLDDIQPFNQNKQIFLIAFNNQLISIINQGEKLKAKILAFVTNNLILEEIIGQYI